MSKVSAVSDQSFLYSVPKVSVKLSGGAQVAMQIAGLASRLVQIERTRCNHPDGRAENDAEHSLMLAKVAPELAHLLYPKLDENLVTRFATLHDDVEAYVGDTPTDMLAGLNAEAKTARESAGLAELARDYAHMPSYIERVREYEAQSVAEARFVRAVDKLMVLLIHIPNGGAVLKGNYTYDAFLQSEADLLARDGYKYGEFDLIRQLRKEIGSELAKDYLSNDEARTATL